MRKHWRHVGRIRPYLRPYRRLAAGSVVMTVLGAVVALAQPWPLAFLVDGVLGHNGSSVALPGAVTHLFGTSPTRLILVAVLFGLVLALLINGVALVTEYLNTSLSQRMIADFRRDLFANATRQTVAFHDARSMGDFIARINYEASSVGAITVALPPLGQSFLELLGMAFIAYRIDPELALLALIIVPFIYYCTGYYGRHIEPRLRHVRGLEGRTISIVMEAMSILRVIACFNRERHENERFRIQARKAVDARVDVTVRQSLFSFAVNVATAAGTALVLGIGSLHVLNGSLSVGELLVMLAYVHAVYTPLQAISHSLASLQEQFIFLAMSLDLLDQEPDIRDRPGASPLPRVIGAIDFDEVCFAYAGRDCTLDRISFHVAPGETVAVVGPTGAGKTTLMSLLSRLSDPGSGRVLIDGHDVRGVTLHSLRAQISVVLQEPALFSGTVADNIRYGRLEATMDDVMVAAQAANAHEFIMRLPEQYETLLGENGTCLSGGERQRICVARAFLKDAPILILDEPTSSIDSRTEEVILDALEKLMKGRTTFMVAHRLSTLRSVDRILVLDHGRLVEQGTHRELIAAEGLYRSLHDVQSAQRLRFYDPATATAEDAAMPPGPIEPPSEPDRSAALEVEPNPIVAVKGSDGGVATVRWAVFGCSSTEIRIDRPDGPVFATALHDSTGTSVQVRETGPWVSDGMTFFLQDTSGGRSLTAENTLARLSVRVVRATALELEGIGDFEPHQVLPHAPYRLAPTDEGDVVTAQPGRRFGA